MSLRWASKHAQLAMADSSGGTRDHNKPRRLAAKGETMPRLIQEIAVDRSTVAPRDSIRIKVRPEAGNAARRSWQRVLVDHQER
jgi:hypothetical protein